MSPCKQGQRLNRRSKTYHNRTRRWRDGNSYEVRGWWTTIFASFEIKKKQKQKNNNSEIKSNKTCWNKLKHYRTNRKWWTAFFLNFSCYSNKFRWIRYGCSWSHIGHTSTCSVPVQKIFSSVKYVDDSVKMTQTHDSNVKRRITKMCLFFHKEHFEFNRTCEFIFQHLFWPLYIETKKTDYNFGTYHRRSIVVAQCQPTYRDIWPLCRANSTFVFPSLLQNWTHLYSFEEVNLTFGKFA